VGPFIALAGVLDAGYPVGTTGKRAESSPPSMALRAIAKCYILGAVRIISRKKLVSFREFHEGAEGPLEKWFKAVTGAAFKSVADIRTTFARHADPVLHWIIFNVGGDAHRIVTTVNYELGIVYIRHVFTHAEYDHWNENVRDKEAKKDQGWIEQRASERESKAVKAAAQKEKKSREGGKTSARKKKKKKKKK